MGLREFLESHYETKETEKRPDEVRVNCVFCPNGDDGFHGYFNVERNVWRCFRCNTASKPGGKGMTAAQYLVRVHNVSFKEADKIIKGGNELESLVIRGRKKSLKEVKEEFMSDVIEVSSAPQVEIKFPSSYKIRPDDTSKIGKAALKFMASRLHSKKRAVSLCLSLGIRYCTRGDYARRIILPVYYDKKLVYFQARSFFPSTMSPPYLNVSEERQLFIPYRPDLSETFIICEGYFDALAIGAGAVAIFGSTMTDAQFDLFLAQKPKRVVVCLDPDEAGIAGAINTCDRLKPYIKDLEIVRGLSGGDPSDVGPRVRGVIEAQCTPYTNYVRAKMVLQE